jgi:hypothetical protein
MSLLRIQSSRRVIFIQWQVYPSIAAQERNGVPGAETAVRRPLYLIAELNLMIEVALR